MKKIHLLIITIGTISGVFGQSMMKWSPHHDLTLKDFKSLQSEINPELSTYSIYPGSSIGFSFHMPRAEFMFTKNFNSKVTHDFNKNAATIIAPDSTIAQQLVNYGQFQFDMTELYARKFRKALYDNKGAFSSANFFYPIFRKLKEEMNAELAIIQKKTNFGSNANLLAEEHQKVLARIEEFSDFCRVCKPVKNKKK